MRVTEKLVSDFINQVNVAAKDAVFNTTQQVISGRNIDNPGDDIVSAEKIISIDRLLTQLDRFERARHLVESDLVTADITASSATNILISAKEIAVQMSSDTHNAIERAAEAQVVSNLKEEMIDLANTQLPDGRFLFSGLAEFTAPYDDAGNYLGSIKTRDVEITPGFFMNASTPGPKVFGDPASAIAVLEELNVALSNNDTVAIQGLMTKIDDAIADLTVGHTDIGGRLKHTSNAQEILDDMRLQAKIQRAELQDVDLAAAITDMTTAEQAMTAVIEASKRLMGASALRWLN